LKFLIIIFFLISTTLFSAPSYAKNKCPKEVSVLLECKPSPKKFQLLRHIGKYLNTQVDLEKKENLLVCSYASKTWSSTYKYDDVGIEKIIQVTSLQGLSNIVQLVDQIGFKVDHFGINSTPFLMLTFKPHRHYFSLYQMFLFSGLENTFDGADNFSVDAFDRKKFSTIIINEKFLKTGNATADTFVTGSDCSAKIK
jgi:hypothetical protein